jgi:hypothetical protein
MSTHALTLDAIESSTPDWPTSVKFTDALEDDPLDYATQ